MSGATNSASDRRRIGVVGRELSQVILYLGVAPVVRSYDFGSSPRVASSQNRKSATRLMWSGSRSYLTSTRHDRQGREVEAIAADDMEEADAGCQADS